MNVRSTSHSPSALEGAVLVSKRGVPAPRTRSARSILRRE